MVTKTNVFCHVFLMDEDSPSTAENSIYISKKKKDLQRLDWVGEER